MRKRAKPQERSGKRCEGCGRLHASVSLWIHAGERVGGSLVLDCRGVALCLGCALAQDPDVPAHCPLCTWTREKHPVECATDDLVRLCLRFASDAGMGTWEEVMSARTALLGACEKAVREATPTPPGGAHLASECESRGCPAVPAHVIKPPR